MELSVSALMRPNILTHISRTGGDAMKLIIGARVDCTDSDSRREPIRSSGLPRKITAVDAAALTYVLIRILRSCQVELQARLSDQRYPRDCRSCRVWKRSSIERPHRVSSVTRITSTLHACAQL